MIGKEFYFPKQINGKVPDWILNFTESHKGLELQNVILKRVE